MRKHRTALRGVALALVMTLAMAGCTDDDPKADPSPTTSTSATSSPTESTTPTTEPETPEQAAIRLATEQTEAYIATYSRLYSDPKLPLSILDDYAETQALAEIKDFHPEAPRPRRSDSWRAAITKTWLGPQRWCFNNEAPKAVVDLYVCFDLNGSHIVDQPRQHTPIEPQVAQARYAIYAQDWPNESPSDWRVGKEYAAGEPCPQ